MMVLLMMCRYALKFQRSAMPRHLASRTFLLRIIYVLHTQASL